MTQDETRTIRIRCSTWDQVESFHDKKLKGSTLVLKLPFQPTPGDGLTVALGLPSGLVFAIDGKAAKVAKNAAGGKYPVAIHLHGLTLELRDRLRTLIEEARADDVRDRATTEKPVAKPAPEKPEAKAKPKAEPKAKAKPEAKPKAKERAEKKTKAKVATVRSTPRVPEQDERAMRKELDTLRQRLLQSAAHDVLGIDDDAGLGAIRGAYFLLAKKHHPDVFGLYRSPRVGRAASEVFIHINKAYDRLRAAAMAAEGIDAAGPALRATPGWVIEFEDVQTAAEQGSASDLAEGSDMLEVTGETRTTEVTEESGPMASAREALLGGQWSAAREYLVEALGGDPRNRGLRALFHVASGMQLREHGRVTESRLHFETALAHDADCVEAQRALALEHQGADRDSVLRRIFQR